MLSFSHIQDFYVLERLNSLTRQKAEKTMEHKDISLYEKVAYAFDDLVPDLAEAMYQYLYLACMGESRHAAQNVAELRFIDGLIGGERDGSYKIAVKYDPAKSIPQLIDIFSQSWAGSYGGKAWLSIAKGAALYGTIPDAAFVDHAVDLRHNNGTAFSKSSTQAVLNFNPVWKFIMNFMEFKKYNDVLSPGLFEPYKLTPRVGTLLESYKGEHNYHETDEDWSWTPTKFGDDAAKIIKKISPWRNVELVGNNVTMDEIKQRLQDVSSETLGIEEKFVLQFGKPEHKIKLEELAYEGFDAKLVDFLPMWKESGLKYESLMKKYKQDLLKGGGANKLSGKLSSYSISS